MRKIVIGVGLLLSMSAQAGWFGSTTPELDLIKIIYTGTDYHSDSHENYYCFKELNNTPYTMEKIFFQLYAKAVDRSTLVGPLGDQYITDDKIIEPFKSNELCVGLSSELKKLPQGERFNFFVHIEGANFQTKNGEIRMVEDKLDSKPILVLSELPPEPKTPINWKQQKEIKINEEVNLAIRRSGKVSMADGIMSLCMGDADLLVDKKYCETQECLKDRKGKSMTKDDKLLFLAAGSNCLDQAQTVNPDYDKFYLNNKKQNITDGDVFFNECILESKKTMTPVSLMIPYCFCSAEQMEISVTKNKVKDINSLYKKLKAKPLINLSISIADKCSKENGINLTEDGLIQYRKFVTDTIKGFKKNK